MTNLFIFAVDSFGVVEMQSRIFRELKGDLSVFEILSPRSWAQLSALLASRSELVPAELKTDRSGD